MPPAAPHTPQPRRISTTMAGTSKAAPVTASTNSSPATTKRRHPNYALGHVLNNKIQITGIIGSGPYSVVYSAIDFYTGEALAVKMIPKRGSSPGIGQSLANSSDPALQTSDFQGLKRPRSMVAESYKHIDAHSLSLDKVYDHYVNLLITGRFDTRSPLHVAYREVALHSKAYKASPQSVVEIKSVLDSSEFFYVVMEYFPTGDLFHAITDRKWYVGNDRRAKDIFNQLVTVVSQCHESSIYHCDLKPENVVVTQDGLSVKLTDFGLATSNSICFDYGCGSSFYMSPERLHRPTTNSPGGFSAIASDIWALGVILLNLTCGRNPWKKASIYDDQSYRAFVKDPKFLVKIMPITPEFCAILSRVFDLDPKRRLTLTSFRDLVLACPALTRQKPGSSASVAPATTPAPVRVIPSPLKPTFYRVPSNGSTCSSVSSGSTALGSPEQVSHAIQTQIIFTKPSSNLSAPQLFPPISLGGPTVQPLSHSNSPALTSEAFDSPHFVCGDISRSPSPYKTGLVPASPGVPPLSPIPPRTSSITGLLPALPLRQPHHGGGHAHHHSSSISALAHPYSRLSPRTPIRSPCSMASSPGARTLVDTPLPLAANTPMTPNNSRSVSISSLNMVYLCQDGEKKNNKSLPSLPLGPSLMNPMPH